MLFLFIVDNDTICGSLVTGYAAVNGGLLAGVDDDEGETDG